MKPLNQCATMNVMRLLALQAIATIALVGCGNSQGALENSAWPGAVEISHPTNIGNTVAFGGPMTLVNESNDDVVVTDVRFDQIDDSLIYLGWVSATLAAQPEKTKVAPASPNHSHRRALEQSVTTRWRRRQRMLTAPLG